MKILIATVSARNSGGSAPAAELLREYVQRTARFLPCTHRNFGSEQELLHSIFDSSARTKPALIVTDRKGQQHSSEEIADVIRFVRDGGIQQLILAIGPASGWTALVRSRADRMIAFGCITLPHELAAVIAAEQVYRALTILAGHPYHKGH